MQDLFETELWQGKTVADLLTLEFLASAAGSVIAAIAILREDNLQRAEFEEWKAAWDRVMVSKFRADHDR